MPTETIAAANPSRPWYRWGRSTYVIGALLAGALVLLNIPGKVVFTPDVAGGGKYGPHFELTDECLHGWPTTYLRRKPRYLDEPPYVNIWNLLEGVEQFSLQSLLYNTAVAIGVALVGAVLFEIWRRRRKRLYHLHVIDLFIIVIVVAAGGAVYSAHRAQFHAELDALRAIESSNDPNVEWYNPIHQRVEWQLGGPSWLRQRGIVGPFRVFDRVIGIDTTGNELEQVVQLRSLKVVRLSGVASNQQLERLAELPDLEALDVTFTDLDHDETAEGDGETSECFRLPRMPRLRGLNLFENAYRGEGLENIPAVETLDLTYTDVDDQAARKLADLHQLRNLSLFGTRITDDGLRHLSGLENLEQLTLTGVSDRGLRHLATLTQLRSLRIDGEQITDESVPLLKRFPRLEDLAIRDSSISENGWAELRAAVPNCGIW